MRILIAAASFSSEMSGVQRHAFNVVRCLLGQPEVSTVHLVLAPWQRELMLVAGFPPTPRLSIHFAEMERSSMGRNLWSYRELPELAKRLEVDLVHLSYPMPLRASAFHCPTVVTLHDLYPFEIPGNFGFPKFIFNRIVLKQCLRAADAIACVSETTRERLGRYSPARMLKKTVRIYNCVEPAPASAERAPMADWHDEPFLLSVAQHRRNKNIPLLIRSFDRLLRAGSIDPRMKLIVIGIAGPETERIHRLTARLGLTGRVQFLSGLPEPELQWCYANCEVLVAPSSTEGFGLPIVEGLRSGCRVVCSDIPAFREVGGGHCRFVPLDGDAEQALADAIAAQLGEPAMPAVSFPQFSASVLAEQYVALYRALIASAPDTEKAMLGTFMKRTGFATSTHKPN